MNRLAFSAVSAGLLITAGCNDGAKAPPGGDPGTAAAEPATAAPSESPNRCAEIKTSGWRAAVNSFPGPNKPTAKLVVTGTAHLTQGGWTVSLADRGETKSIPSMQMLELVATNDGVVSTDPVEDHEVRFERDPGAVGTVSISCGRMQVAKLVVERPQ